MNAEQIREGLQKLLELDSLEKFNEKEALQILQNLIDYSNALNVTTGTKKAIALTEGIIPLQKIPNELFVYHYFMGIAWGDLRKAKHKTAEDWYWEHEELENEVTHYRLALIHFKDEERYIGRYLQICTNLGGSFDSMGRFISAMDMWQKALDKHSKFGMAMSSKASSAIYHASITLFDSGHQSIYFCVGCQLLKESLNYELIPEARRDYETRVSFYENNFPKAFTIMEHLYPIQYVSAEDFEYRTWAYNNTLFLHSLNDIQIPDAEYDPLLLPPMFIREEAGDFHSFFNQIKQEYISARYFLYHGIKNKSEHFSDTQAAKYDMYDLSINSLQIEHIKTAFRMAYSIFDKVAFFINYYMKLGIPEKKVFFRTLWFSKPGILRDEFKQRQNLMFRGLYWLSKDLYYKEEENFVTSIEPEAREIANIRNHIEHKSFRVIFDDAIHDLKFIPKPLQDNLSFSIGETDFHSKTMKVLKMAREAIMYLSFGIHHEERLKNRPDGFIPSIEMPQK